jgi:hypothetical protein
MNYLAIVLIFIILIILYYVYYYLTNTSFTAGLQPLDKQLTITYEKMTNPSSLTYSYQAWIYISEPTQSRTPIFYRTLSPNDPNNFELSLQGQTLTLFAGRGDTGIQPKKIMVITNNFIIQKWIYLAINVINTQTFEVYINGKLVKTVNVTSANAPIPTSKMSNLYIGNASLKGYVTKFTRLTSAIDAKTVWNNYLSGNGLNNSLSTIMPYGLKMSVSKGEDLQRVITVF